MLSAKSITVPFICEQTKCFGSEGTINYKDSLMDCCIKWAVFLNQIAWGKDFFSINETSKTIFAFKVRGVFNLYNCEDSFIYWNNDLAVKIPVRDKPKY